MTPMRAVHADAVVTGDGDAIRDAAVVVDERGEVIDVGRAGDVLPRHGGIAVERARGVLVPGLVNAHTHLELSALRGCVPGGAGFVPWVEHLIGARVEARPEDDAKAIERASRSSTRAAPSPSAKSRTRSAPFTRSPAAASSVASSTRCSASIARPSSVASQSCPASSKSAWDAWPSPELAYAPTPHTLYTTHPRASCVVSFETRAIVTSERSPRRARAGATRSSNTATARPQLVRGSAEAARGDHRMAGQGSRCARRRVGAYSPHVLCVHLTDARPRRARTRRPARAPRRVLPALEPVHRDSTAAAPRCARAGIVPALGTDSLASNASLDVLAEARALADRFPTVPAVGARFGWRPGRARARSVCADVGRIARGARPGIFAVEGQPEGRDPARSSSPTCARRVDGSRARRRRPCDEGLISRASERTDRSWSPSRTPSSRCRSRRAPSCFAGRAARAADGLAHRRDARVHGVRAHERDGVQPLGGSRHRRQNPRTEMRHVPGRAVRRAKRSRSRGLGAASASSGARRRWASGPASSPPPCSACCSAIRTPSASRGARTRGSASRSRSRPAAPGSRWGASRPRASCC
jgi:cytosine/adenosine deaminase-related metal-dependent hydrolase